MLRSYFTIAWRNLVKNKLYSFINITGLSLGIAACLLIGIFIRHELDYDHFQEKGERISRVIMEYSFGGSSNKGNYTSTKVGPSFKRNFPEVEEFVRMSGTSRIVKYNDKLFVEKRFVYADSTFPRLFSFPVLNGNAATALNGPNKVVLTRSMAQKYFGSGDPVGKILKISSAQAEYEVTAVIEDCPENSQLKYDFIASFSSLGANQEQTYWNANYTTYLLHKHPADRGSLQGKIPGFMKKEMKADLSGNDFLTYYLEPFYDVHLYSEFPGLEPNRSISYLYILGAVALLILFIACFTFINLCTAKSLERAKEIGIRKVTGALKGQIFWQFIGESLLTTFVSSVLGFALAFFLLPYFNELVGAKINMADISLSQIVLLMLALVFVISILAGTYPAIVLSSFRPVLVLKGMFRNTSSGLALRKSLFVFQFVISVFLIVCTLIVKSQLDYFQSKKLGFDKDHVLVLPTDSKVLAQYDAFKNELKAIAGVRNISRADFLPCNIVGGYSMYKPEMQAGTSFAVNAGSMDEEYLTTCGIKIIAGSNITAQDIVDASKEDYTQNFFHFVLNESAARQLGWKPAEAIGKKMFLDETRPGIVKAVVEDFHFSSLHNPIKPLVLYPSSYWANVLLIKLSGKDLQPSIQLIGEKWKKQFQHRPYEYEFLDENYKAMYESEARLGTAMTVFSSVAVFLSLLGLFGLAGYSIHQRTREIGVLKVFGAPVHSIVYRLSRNFILLVVISFLLAFPLAGWLMSIWLSDFSYRIEITFWYFLIAGLGSLLVAFGTIGVRALRAAMANPVKSLRTE